MKLLCDFYFLFDEDGFVFFVEDGKKWVWWLLYGVFCMRCGVCC